MTAAVAPQLYAEAAAALRPDPELTVSEWADRNRVLSSKESPEPGPWRTSRVPYLREIMDCLSVTSPVQRVVLMKGAQVGGSEVGNNWLGYVIDHSPAPMLVVQPTVELAERFSKQRIASMIAGSPVLQERVGPARSRDSGNTIHSKEFPGGMLIITGANSAAGLRSMPIKDLFADEVDGYPMDVDGEGDPLDLAEQRTANFRRKKIFLPSTPTRKGFSRIEKAYLASDRRRYWVPCQHCGEMQTLRWEQVHWPPGHPEEACYVCAICACEWDDVARIRSLPHGQWRAELPFRGTAGFHLPAFYSPWLRLGELAEEFLEKKKHPERLKTFVNTKLAETWEEKGESIDPTGLMARRESYDPDPVPEGVVAITAGVDIQDDRIEMEVLGWGLDEENWSLEYLVFVGDPSSPAVWREVDDALKRRYHHPLGVKLPIRCACVDSGGHHTQAVYEFCEKRYGRRVLAIKGMDGEGRPIVGKPSRNNKRKVRLFPVGVDTAKTRLYARLQVSDPGPGYCHFPDARDQEYFEQLTAEKVVTKYHRGRPKRVWTKKDHQRNEALDCRVYAMAALEAWGGRLSTSAQRLQSAAQALEGRAAPPLEKPKPSPLQPPRPPRGGSWVNGWR